jgi:glycine cleavage system regulatory protein
MRYKLPTLQPEPAMTTPLVMTFIGRDKPGLVNVIAHAVAEHGGAWLESRLARLAGEFAGIVRVDVPDERIADLAAALRELEASGLRVTVERGDAPEQAVPRETLKLELLGLDRPGIVRDVTAALTRLGVNIEEFESGLQSAAFTGAPMFQASALLHAPEGLSIAELSATLERLAGELMVDISVSEGGAG